MPGETELPEIPAGGKADGADAEKRVEAKFLLKLGSISAGSPSTYTLYRFKR